MNKMPVHVKAETDVNGLIKPLSMFYEDEEYPIDRIINVRPLSSLKSGGGGEGYWYKCAVGDRAIFLTYDGTSHKWQLELPAA